jgi:hypothetical protein
MQSERVKLHMESVQLAKRILVRDFRKFVGHDPIMSVKEAPQNGSQTEVYSSDRHRIVEDNNDLDTYRVALSANRLVHKNTILLLCTIKC